MLADIASYSAAVTAAGTHLHPTMAAVWERVSNRLPTAEDRAALRIHRHLTAAAAAWVASDRDASELYRGQRLAVASEWRATDTALSTTEEEFLDASTAEQDRELRNQIRANRRLRTLLSAVAVALVVALVAGAVAFVQRRRTAEARDRADVEHHGVVDD